MREKRKRGSYYIPGIDDMMWMERMPRAPWLSGSLEWEDLDW